MNENKFNILIIDDIIENIQILLEILYCNEYLFAFATCAEDAFAAIENQMPDIILLDIMMPGTNGYEVCRILKENKDTAEIPVIFLSAKSELTDKLHGFELGAVDYITKPYDNEDVIARVKNHLALKKALDTNKKLVAQLTDLNRTKDKFFSIIAHDLKNPFSVLISFSDLLLKNYNQYSDEKKIKFIQLMADSSQKSFDLLQNLLEWSRVQTGRLVFKPEIIDIRICIEDVLLLLRSQAENKQITIHTYQQKHINVLADKYMLDTILRNLINNAIKFTNQNGNILVAVVSNSDNCEISIEDNGVGIDELTIQKLFRIDGGVSSEGTANEKGTGLGLILSKEFVEKNNGKIWVESTVNKGTTFYFTLPLHQ